jgi:DNA-binding NarL/FixJ family response regulator
VLVADDSDTVQQTVSELMEMEPTIELIGRAGNGLETIEAVAALQPDLVIMEVHLPYLDGLQTSALIARHYPDVQIVLMSCDDSAKTREQGRLHGAHAFIPKTELIQGMHQALCELFPSLPQITARPA